MSTLTLPSTLCALNPRGANLGLISCPTHMPRCAPNQLSHSPCLRAAALQGTLSLPEPDGHRCPPPWALAHQKCSLPAQASWLSHSPLPPGMSFSLLCPLPPYSPSFQVLGAKTDGSDGILGFPRCDLPSQIAAPPGAFLCMDLLPKSLVQIAYLSLPHLPLWATLKSTPATWWLREGR